MSKYFVHARDPYKRIDTTPSSRHVQVRLGGEIVADTRHAKFLFETGLPTRYYIPKEDVRTDLLTLTFAAKDIIDIAGRVTGCGNPDWADSHGPALRPLSP